MAARRKSPQPPHFVEGIGPASFLLKVLPKSRFTYVAVNDRFAEALGLTRNDLVGKNLGQTLISSSVSSLVEKCLLCIETSSAVEVKIFAGNAENLRAHTFSLFPVTKNGRTTQILGTALEFFQREPSFLPRFAFPDSGKSATPGYDALEVGTFEREVVSVKISLSPEEREILDHGDEHDPTLRSILKTVHPEDRDWLDAMAQQVLARGKGFEIEFSILPKGKSERVVTVRGQLIRNAVGDPEKIVGTIVGVTQKRRAVDAQRISENLLRTIVTNAPVILWAIEKGGTIILSEGRGLDKQGLKAGDLVGSSIFEVYAENPEFLENVRKGLAGKVFNATNETRGTLFERWFEPIQDANGKIVGLVGVSIDVTKKVKAENDFKANQALLQTVLDALPLSVYVKDLESRFVLGNKTMLKNRGISPDQLPNLATEDLRFVSERQKQVFLEGDRRVFESGKRVDIPEIGVNDASGNLRFYNQTKLPLRDAQGRITGLVGVSEDITQRMRVDTQLWENRRMMGDVLNSLPLSISLRDLGSRLIFVNRTWEQWFGLKMGNVEGKKIGDLKLFPGPQWEETRKMDVAIQQGAETNLQKEMPWTFPGRVNKRIRTTKVPLNDEHGKVSGVVTVHEDITTQHAAEEELRNQRQLLKTVFDSLPLWVFVKDTEGNYLMVNQAMTEDTGFSKEGFEADGWWTAEQRAERTAEDREVLEKGIRLDFPEQEIFFGNESNPRIFNTIKAPLREGENRVVGLLGVSQDVTVQKRTEFQLLQSQKMEAIGQLAGGVAHDFNNLLQVIQGYSQRALSAIRRKIKRDISKDLEKIFQASEIASNLTAQLLAFSPQQVLRFSRVNVDEVIIRLTDLLSRVIGEDIHLEFLPGKRAALVNGDRGMLEQVLMNLVVNARDAMPEGGHLLIETNHFLADQGFCDKNPWATPGEYLRISISDTGLGIDKDDLQHIFEPFFTTKQPGKGTGLGLSVVHGMVEQHGGQVTVYSEKNLGTTFRIFFPIFKDTKNGAQPVGKSQFHTGGDETVLVAEDDPVVLELVVEELEGNGYTVFTAEDGVKACIVFDQHSEEIDLVLLDVVMPRMRGLAVYEHIRKTHPELPVLFATGYSGQIIDADLLDENKLKVLQKPYPFSELFRAIRGALD